MDQSVDRAALEESSATARVGMWVFLVTDAMSFSGLLIAYAVLRAGGRPWPPHRLNLPFTAVTTLVLVASSLTMALALSAACDGRPRAVTTWLTATVAGGLLFLCGQGWEWHQLVSDKGAGLAVDQMWSTFFVITGFHGLHVAAGVLWLGLLAARRRLEAAPVELAGLFWQFVDLIWVVIFTFVYLPR
jgi:heme/copper-type cytochrome/quinol oxidase subunit 3